MSIENDETLQVYIEESLEHLADIENDFLAIEETGADIDEELVNKVYRAAHSIKGGAGFMGLVNIKDLTHEMENILGKVRSKELVPNPEIINILLLASDALRDMINNIHSSNEMNISEHVEALKSINDFPPDQAEKEPASSNRSETSLKATSFFPHAEESISSAGKEGKHVYLVNVDLIRDFEEKDETQDGIIDDMRQTGIILGCKTDAEAVGVLDPDWLPKKLPLKVLFASILKPEDINALFEINERDICEVMEDLSLSPLGDAPVLDSPVSITDNADNEPEEIPAPEIAHQDETQIETETQMVNTVQEPAEQKKARAPATSTIADTSLRVHVSLLDSLMTLAGELVLSRNQLIQSLSAGDHRASEIAGQRIDLITSELQEAIMLTRMQAIGNVFNKFPRVVRDLAGNLGKDVELTIEGKDVELDKTIIEAISDPLTHLVRNSVDHGIETPEQRKKAGKDPKGNVLLKAFHEAGQVNIEISDDGKGLDGGKLANAAMAKGLINSDQAGMMSEKEKVNLIFLPGFSTAEKVTDVSGRGVGMDVVKTNLDKLGGVVDIDSRPNKGTTIRIKLPLTLAIIPSQIISMGGERYAIPQVNLKELLRIPADQVKQRIEIIGNAEVVRLRGKLLPLIRLADVIGVERSYLDPEEKILKRDRRQNIADRRSRQSPISINEQSAETQIQENESQTVKRNPVDRRYRAASAVNIVVVSTGTIKYGLVVDELHDSEEIVVKPLGRHLKHCKGYAGATIMGDGRVALILDVAGLAGMAELTSAEGADRAKEAAKEADGSKEDKQSLLIFRNAEDEQFAVPLGLVSRIEKIKRNDIEEVGGKKVIQYRGSSLPLVNVEDAVDVNPLTDSEDLLVIVFLLAGREAGLLASAPVDATDVSADFDENILKQTAVMGSAIIGGYTTLMLDIFGLLEAVDPDWFSESHAVKSHDGKAITILYAEDSKFFRTQVKNYLEEDGYNVIEAEDGIIAWDLLCEHADEISLVLTDIEMPNLDGFGLTGKIKNDPRFSHLPVIAMTTLAGEEDMARGKAAGVNDYQIKLDKEKLTESIHGLLEAGR